MYGGPQAGWRAALHRPVSVALSNTDQPRSPVDPRTRTRHTIRTEPNPVSWFQRKRLPIIDVAGIRSLPYDAAVIRDTSDGRGR